ncbi:Pentatricopeptide repeat-containing protein [Actinidia chinensis var. chinensis]|uniref:Pentatricopeptide repeat-containing protein n=1 Tax=Actinidia chinensis var. chinensis TaxID=1590841 RepID=A0A2R6QHP4_ACTCC|nr:Pentatricopeptide repeat-containing protein [Actinidia chinensis var. chinensis]
MRALAKLISSTHPSLNLPHPTLESFIWNTIIRAHVQRKARPTTTRPTDDAPTTIFLRMRFHGVDPDFHTFPFLLQSFTSPPYLHSGQSIHAQIFCFRFDTDPFVQTSLITMYSACGDLGFAQQVFDEIVQPDLPSWNSIMNANVKMGLVKIARKMFDKMPERNVISWSCMMDGYVRCGEYKEALALFREMQKLDSMDVRPNEFTMSVVLSACGRLGALEHGKWAHAYIDKCGMKVGVVLGSCLVDMYAKCGSIERARWVFNILGSDKDVMAWSAMISGLAMHGHSEECLEVFSVMTSLGVRPNAVTFLGVLCACVHGGLVSEGESYFRRMRVEFGIAPLIQHYGCVVDLYGRAGLIDAAWSTINSMPMEPDVPIWGALLSGSRMHGDIRTCEFALKKLIELEPTNSGAYVLLSNVYAKTGKWKEVRHLRDAMEANRIRKVPGCSMVEVGGIIHEFFVGDESHPETREIRLMLDEIMQRLKMEGYVGNTNEVLLDLDDEEGKELALSLHSEKLAVAFAILKTSAGMPIHIVKILRICRDCHVAIKMISRIFARYIVVRDCNRFHHFANGVCSCKDYW